MNAKETTWYMRWHRSRRHDKADGPLGERKLERKARLKQLTLRS